MWAFENFAKSYSGLFQSIPVIYLQNAFLKLIILKINKKKALSFIISKRLIKMITKFA